MRISRILFIVQIVLWLLAWVPREVSAESLYIIAGFSLLRTDLNGSNVEVIIPFHTPDCQLDGVTVAPSGEFYIVESCSPPIARVYKITDKAEVIITIFGHRPIKSLRLDPTGQTLYFAVETSAGGEIRRMFVDLDVTVTIVTNSGPGVWGLDLDSSRGKLYWTRLPQDGDPSGGSIQRANLDGSNVETFVTGLVFPTNVRIDEQNAKVYWTDGGAGRIQRAEIADGSIVETLVEGLGFSEGLALDLVSRKMYWSNDTNDRVQRGNLDGSAVEDVLTTFSPRALDIGSVLVSIEKQSWGNIKNLFR